MSDVDDLRTHLIEEREADHDTGAAALAAVARVEYFNRQRDAGARDVAALTCPGARLPSVVALFRWLASCPSPTWDAVASAERAHGPGAVAWLSGLSQLVPIVGLPAPLGEHLVDRSLVECSRQWRSMPAPRPRHPLAPLVDSWQRLAPERGRIADKDVQIMARNVAMVEQDAPGYYLSRFGAAAHQSPDGQLLMDFATESERGPTLPAEVWTMGMPEAEKRGAVIPLPFRIWISVVLHVPLHARHGDYPIRLEGTRDDPLTLRRFLSWPYSLPRNQHTGRIAPPGPASYWGTMIDAIDLINAHETPYVRNGHLWLRRVVTVDKPGEYNPAMLDDPWGVTVWLPPGDGTGPRIRLHRLQRWWRHRGGDAAAVRALINLRFRWYIEGKRVAPVAKAGPWLQRRDPKVYDKLTDAAKDAIFYPAGTGKNVGTCDCRTPTPCSRSW